MKETYQNSNPYKVLNDHSPEKSYCEHVVDCHLPVVVRRYPDKEVLKKITKVVAHRN